MTLTNIIKYVGLNKLHQSDKNTIKEFMNLNYEKIQRELYNITNLIAHVKLYGKEGETKKYSIHIRVESPALKFTSNLSGWDLRKTLHKVTDNLIKEIKHKIKK